MKSLFAALAVVLSVFSLSAQTLPEGYSLLGVSNESFAWVKSGDKNNVEISFTTPKKIMNDVDFSTMDLPVDITKITIERSVADEYMFQPIHTFYAPAKGVSLSWVDEDVPFGMYDYIIFVHVGELTDWGVNGSVLVGELPGSFGPDDFTVVPDAKDGYKLLLTVTLPTLNSLGKPLTMPYTKVVFSELNMIGMPVPIETVTEAEMLTPGSKIEYEIAHVADGEHQYCVEAFTQAGGNDLSYEQIFVGFDQPGPVGNLHAEMTENGVLVTWEAPNKGDHGGNMGDPSQITYTIRRGVDQYDALAEVLAEHVSELQWLDTTEFGEESLFCYIVTSSSPYGDGYPTVSNALIAGHPADLPFTENFDKAFDEYGNTTSEHSTWQKSFVGDYFCAWQIGQETYRADYEQVKPHNGNGLLYAYYSIYYSFDQCDDYTSGHISLSGAEAPSLSFWYYDMSDSQGSQHVLVQASSDDESFATLLDIEHGKAESFGWRLVQVDLSEYKDQVIKIRFRSEAQGSGCVSMAIDELQIVADVNGIESLESGRKPHSGIYNLQGMRQNSLMPGINIVDGRIIMIR